MMISVGLRYNSEIWFKIYKMNLYVKNKCYCYTQVVTYHILINFKELLASFKILVYIYIWNHFCILTKIIRKLTPNNKFYCE